MNRDDRRSDSRFEYDEVNLDMKLRVPRVVSCGLGFDSGSAPKQFRFSLTPFLGKVTSVEVTDRFS